MSANEKISLLLEQLQQFDTPKGYRMEYKTVQKKLKPVMEGLISFREESLSAFHELLQHEETWSCLFALEILKEIKSEKSIFFLIEFIKRSDDSDYWESGERAMFALTAIGEKAIPSLLEEVKTNFKGEKYYHYLIGALLEIKNEQVYQFMIEIMVDYIKDYKKYDHWFDIVPFVLDFDKQERKEAIPLLEKLMSMEHLSNQERREIEDTIEILKDKDAFEEKIKLLTDNMGDSYEEMEKLMSPKKQPIDKEEFFKRASEPDERFEANFRCQSCDERQNLKTGMIWNHNDGNFSFENEIMCRHCCSHVIILTSEGKREIEGKMMRTIMGDDKGILPVGNKVMVENKKKDLAKTDVYFLQRIKEEPENGELYLRAGNNARKKNKYQEAIEFYKKSVGLNPELIASYLNLVEIYVYRFTYYKQEEAKKEAEHYFPKLVELFNTNQYNSVTIRDDEAILSNMLSLGNSLGFHLKKEKIGRNDSCPCGSGIKYKKCCLEE